MTESSELSGVVPRMAAVLRDIGASTTRGARLVDLSESTGIARPTVHRMLKDLVAEGFVLQTPAKTYILGPQLYWLGLAAQAPIANLPAIRNIAQQIAQETGDTVYVGIRHQAGIRYVLRAEGDFPIRPHLVSVGQFKPFTSSYGGIALLATMPDAVVDGILANIVVDAPGAWAAQQPLAQEIRGAIAQVRAERWHFLGGVVMPNISGMAAVAPTSEGPSPVAISMTTIEARLSRERAESLAPALTAAASRIADHL